MIPASSGTEEEEEMTGNLAILTFRSVPAASYKQERKTLAFSLGFVVLSVCVWFVALFGCLPTFHGIILYVHVRPVYSPF